MSGYNYAEYDVNGNKIRTEYAPNTSSPGYAEKLKQRLDSQNAAPAAPTVSEGVTSAGEKMGAQMAQGSAAEGNMLGTAGGAMMMTGNPYLMAGGLGLSVLAGGEANKRKQQEAQRQEYNERIQRRQAMMQQIAQMGIK